MENLITVEEALAHVLEHARDFGTESVSLENSIGRILREPIVADRDFPPYDRVTMDGIAISHAEFEKGCRTFRIEGVAAAGDVQKSLQDETACLEVMTGAVMPKNATAVIRYEDLSIKDNQASIKVSAVEAGQNIHKKGEDRLAGSTIISPGVKISSSEVGVCATVGKSEILVSKFPRTIIISTGDELVDIHEKPEPHQIRRSNVYRLKTALTYFGIPVETAHLNDDEDEIAQALEQYLNSYELILISGGVSKGKFDFLPSALEAAGVQKLFHKIKQRPGKPFWFGVHEKATVFAFPGNPVSSFMCMQQYFKPWLEQSLQQRNKPRPFARLTSDVSFKPDLTYFLEVQISYSDKGEILATPVKGNGSGDLANLVDAEAFIVLPAGKDLFSTGEVYPIIFYRES